MRHFSHSKKVEHLQQQLRTFFEQNKSKESSFVALEDRLRHSNTTRTKSYKQSAARLDFTSLDCIVEIDTKKRIALVEPRVTVQELTQATLSHGFIAPIVPEFKGITVGGAIMGGAAESSSHRWGGFNDICSAYEILCGNGDLLRVSPQEHSDLFYGIAGSYGSFGALVLAEIQLVPAKEFVHLRYHFFPDPLEALSFIQQLAQMENPPDFLDGIIFSKDRAVIIEGTIQSKEHPLPCFSPQPLHSEWYYQHVNNISTRSHIYEEVMTLYDYLFRYDQGAFWMGAYLFHFPLLARFIGQGILNIWHPEESFSAEEVQRFHQVPIPNVVGRTLFHPFLTSKSLWKLLHKAEKWVQERIIIQDFCIPEMHAARFLQDILEDPGTFPMWLCPIKGTKQPQIFAPHLLPTKDSFKHFINFGIYGLPSYYTSIAKITKQLEAKAKNMGGRKVLYSRSYYTPDEFWNIYSRPAYEVLRAKTSANGIWHEITAKVLSE